MTKVFSTRNQFNTTDKYFW